MNDDRKVFRMPGATPGTDNGTTVEIIVHNWERLTFQLGEANGGAFTATVTVQGRLHASMPWEDIDAFTDSVLTEYRQALQAIRLVVTGYSAGTLVAAVAGFNVQQ